VRHELLNFLDHTSSPTVFSSFLVARSLVFCVVFCRSLFVFSSFRVARSLVFCVVLCRLLFVLCLFYLLSIVLSVLLQFTSSDYPFSIFNFLICYIHWNLHELGSFVRLKRTQLLHKRVKRIIFRSKSEMYKWPIVFNMLNVIKYSVLSRGRSGCDRMVVGFTTTYAISDYHHWCCKLESRSGRGIQHYVIKFVSDLRQAGGFPRILRFPPPIHLTATI